MKDDSDQRHPEFNHGMPLGRTGLAAAIILSIVFLIALMRGNPVFQRLILFLGKFAFLKVPPENFKSLAGACGQYDLKKDPLKGYAKKLNAKV